MKTIAWDVDDVLNDLMGEWLARGWKREHPECELALADVVENPPHQLLGTSLDEYLASLDRFRLAHGDSLAPVPEIARWFEANGARFRHLAVTAVPRRAAHVTAAWVTRHFGTWIQLFAFVPSARAGETPPSGARTKAELLQWAKADAFVDDNPEWIEQARAAGIESFEMPRPWNRAGGDRAQILAELVRRFA